MDARAFLRGQLGIQRALADAVLGGVTDAQVNWTPPGTVNTIGTILLHLHGTEDGFIARLTGQPTTWESGGWAEKIGIPMTPGRAGYWDEANASTFSLAPIVGYLTAVRAALDAFIAGASEEEFARPMPSPFGEQPMIGILGLFVVHAAHHFGEIAALKGEQGAKGLPF